MTFILKRVELPEKDEVAQLIENNPNVLDGSLQLIGKNLGPRNEHPWDLVGVRQDKRLILIAIETRVTDKILLKLLGNLDWAWENVETFASIYASYGIDSGHMPCVMLVAPSYPFCFKKSLNYLTYRLELNLFTYSCLESEKGRGMLVEPVEKKAVHYEHNVKTDAGIRIEGEGFSKNAKITTEEIMEFLQ